MSKSIIVTQFLFFCLILPNLHKCLDTEPTHKMGSVVPNFQYLGCFNDKREARDIAEKDVSFITKYNKTIATVELCVSLCDANGFKYAGVQAYDECYCGNTYGRYNATDKAKCFFHCGGKYTCGGYNANSVYALSTSPLPEAQKALPKQKPVIDPCQVSLCLNSGKCIATPEDTANTAGYICQCTNKIDSGKFCEERNYCANTPCYNGGTCTNTFNGFQCQCTAAWRGFNCRYRSLIQQPEESTVSPALSFTQSPTTTKQTFMTSRAYTYQPPVTPKFASSDCFSYGRQCQNGGRCVKIGYTYSCRCSPGFSGRTCEESEVDICVRTNPCLNGGECSPTSATTYECKCQAKYEGLRCEKTRIPCEGVTCENSGVCVNNATAFDYYCMCEGGFAGKHCEECKPNFTGEKCDKCAVGFAGDSCELTSPFCSPNPCQNGLCLWDSTGFRCVCSEGWTGKNCSVKNCVLKPCLNGGVCKGVFDSTQTQMDYQCLCSEGFNGKQCENELDPCKSSPCQPAEECIRSKTESSSYTCVKPTNLCDRLKPCNNNSECIYSKENDSFTCRCLNGASECETTAGDTTQKTIREDELLSGLLFTNETILDTNQTRLFPEEIDSKDIPVVGFNYDNLYWILPVCLVVFVVVLFLTIVMYFGFKARNRSAKFSKKANNIRNIHYVNETMSYDENLKPIPNVSSTSISYSEHNSEREFADGYGRV